jgi:hypothetical protein
MYDLLHPGCSNIPFHMILESHLVHGIQIQTNELTSLPVWTAYLPRGGVKAE